MLITGYHKNLLLQVCCPGIVFLRMPCSDHPPPQVLLALQHPNSLHPSRPAWCNSTSRARIITVLLELVWCHMYYRYCCTERVTECDVARMSEEFRAAQDGFVSLSFPTISGSGENGAIIHYRVSSASLSMCCCRLFCDSEIMGGVVQ